MKQKYNKSLFLVWGLVSLTILSGLILFSTETSKTYAESSNAAVTVSAACTMNIANAGTHTAEIIPGGIEEIVSDGINISCNDAGGYALYAIGYSGDSYTASNHTKLISTLNSDNDIATNTSGASSYWAMKITASGTNAPSIDNSFGSYQQVPDTYTEVSHRTTSTAGTNNSVTTPTYKVSIASNQIADTYTGKVKYTLVHPNSAAEPEIPLDMQDITLAQCQKNVGTNGNSAGIGDNIIVRDKRDGNEYTARYVNGECWMTQNLRITGTISATDSNYSGNLGYNISAYDLATDGVSGGICRGATGYTNPCTKDSGNTTAGVWYNYCAATVGTICTSDTATAATQDVCPANWHLPSGPSTTSNTDFNKLVGNTTSGLQDPTDGLTAFGAVSGGAYLNGSLSTTGGGNWWSATAYDGTRRHLLRYDSSNGQFRGDASTLRSAGLFVRCVKDKDTLYMQDVATWGGNLATGQEVTAIDRRDGKEYTVAKLADGNIWMMQNLDHNIVTDGSVTYDSTTTDIPSAWSPSTATYATNTTTWNNSTTAPESYDPGDLCWNGVLDEDWETTLDNGTTTCGNDKHYHIGNYYNWTAAVAMSDSSSYTTQNTDANQSICPAGWMLPKSGTTLTGSGSFLYLKNQLSLTSGTSGNIQSSPVYFVYGGDWSGSSSYYVGSVGNFWSSVVYSYGAYDLYFDLDGYLYPQGSGGRSSGLSVRCVAR